MPEMIAIRCSFTLTCILPFLHSHCMSACGALALRSPGSGFGALRIAAAAREHSELEPPRRFA
eukprot:2045522-Pleurochrysis_carterae.AAC.1